MAIRKRLIWGVYRNLTKGVLIFFQFGGDYFLKVAISQAKIDEKHVLYILRFTCQGLQKSISEVKSMTIVLQVGPVLKVELCLDICGWGV